MYVLPNLSSQDIRAGRPIKSNPANPQLQGPEKASMVYQLGLIVSLFCGFFAGSRWLTVDSEMQSSGTIRIPVVIPSVNGCSDNYDFIHPVRIAVNAYPARIHIWIQFPLLAEAEPAGLSNKEQDKKSTHCLIADIHFFKNHDYNEAGSEAHPDAKIIAASASCL